MDAFCGVTCAAAAQVLRHQNDNPTAQQMWICDRVERDSQALSQWTTGTVYQQIYTNLCNDVYEKHTLSIIMCVHIYIILYLICVYTWDMNRHDTSIRVLLVTSRRPGRGGNPAVSITMSEKPVTFQHGKTPFLEVSEGWGIHGDIMAYTLYIK